MSTAGLQSSGSDFIGLNDVLKHKYEPVLQNLLVSDSELHDLFTEQERFQVQDGADGKQINISHLFSGGGGAGFVDGETGYIPTPTLPSTKQSSITIKGLFGSAELSGKVMRRMKDSSAAIADWAEEQLPKVVERIVHHKDRALVGPGTGTIARVNEGSPDTSLVIDTAFGVSGLTGASKLFMEGDSIRLSPNANGTSPRTNAAVVNSIEYGSETLNIDALPTSGADNDYIYLGDANVSANPSEIMGLLGHVDDGSVVATYQGLSRTTYPKLKSQVVSATASGYTGTLSEDLLVAAGVKCWEYGKGQPNVLVAGYSGAMSFWKSMKGDRSINDPRGAFSGGTKLKEDLSCIVGMKRLTIRPCRKVPAEVAFLVDTSVLKMYRLGKGRWDDTDGSIWNRVVTSTGRRDAFFAVYVEELETAGFAPLRHVKITNLTAQ